MGVVNMSIHKEISESYGPSEFFYEESSEDLIHRKQIRKMLEKRLEYKRLREEIDELDGDFDWDELDR